MPEKKRSAAAGKTAKTTKKTGGGAKSKTEKAKKQSRAVATAKKNEAAVVIAAEAAPKRKTRTKAPRTKIKKLDVPVVMTAEEIEEQEYSDEEYNKFLVMYESTIQDFKEGEIVTGKVMAVTRDDVIVDVGFKSEGIIPISEFTPPINVAVSDQIDVFLEAIEDNDGQLVLSKQKADFLKVWSNIKDAHDAGETIEGRVVRRIKGGLVVDLFGVDSFLPGSQVALRQVPDFDALINQTMELKIIKINKSRRNIVVSRRSVLEEQRKEMREALLEEIQPGQVREGIVKNITDFGVFIDLGGVDGLLHITDMSWGRINHPSEITKLGQEIRVKILDFDQGSGRISLGLKQLTPYPWENVEEKFPVNSRVKGKVVSITDYGAFIELERGVEGLIHISEMSWTHHIKHPSKMLSVNDQVEAVVLTVDKENEKISLGLKQLEPDPWLTIDLKYPLNSNVSGKVRNLTTFGAFVEIEDGIDGLIHISDMSWTKRIQHPSEIMKKNDTIEVRILSIDKENRRISLGLKQVIDDPWPDLEMRYAINTETLGTLTRLLDRGVIVELDGDVEGFVPTHMLGKTDISKPAEAFSEGDEIPLRVVEFDSKNRKILLSVEAYYAVREKDELEKFVAEHPTLTVKVGEILGEELAAKSEASAEVKPEKESKPPESEQPSEDVEVKAETEPEPEPESEPEPVPEPEPEPEPEPVSNPETEDNTEAGTETEPK
ncbi:MAG: 30S ribosomal protein S1 [candidate division Zixibacteria bacterium]|nr:30S ribosomal protein S1 [candidate division Zixibacteria bacterium]